MDEGESQLLGITQADRLEADADAIMMQAWALRNLVTNDNSESEVVSATGMVSTSY